MTSELDLQTLEIGGFPSLWIFVDDWGTTKSNHKDGETFKVTGFSNAVSNDGKTVFPIIELETLGEFPELYRLSVWALRSKEKVKALTLIGKMIKLTKASSRLNFEVMK